MLPTLREWPRHATRECVAMRPEEDDPLQLFSLGRTDSCLGSWKNDKLELRISESAGKLVLESGNKVLVLAEAGEQEWTVADATTPEKHVYIASVSGCGFETRLTLRPPGQKGTAKKAILQRVEHVTSGPPGWLTAAPGRDTPASESLAIQDVRAGGGPAPDVRLRAAPDRDNGQSRRRSRSRSRRRSPEDSRSPEPGRGRSRSRSPSGGGRRRGGGGGRRDRGGSPRGGGGKGRGGGGGKDKPDEEVTTLFVTGLPNDAAEDEVQADIEREATVLKVVLMRRGLERNAFVRFESRNDAQRVMERLLDGKLEVCQTRVKAEMARRNTN